MAKPILICKVDTKNINQFEIKDTMDNILSVLKKSINEEYHVIVVGNSEVNHIDFEVLNTDKADQVTLEKLQELLNEIQKTYSL